MTKGTRLLLSRSLATILCVFVCLLAAQKVCLAQKADSTVGPQAGETLKNTAPAPATSAASDPATHASKKGTSLEADAATQLRIGPGDELDISVYDVPELTQHVRVENTGDISLPLIDRVHVAGLTSAQAQEVIERSLESGGFIKNPHVALFVKEYSNGGIVVQGQVNKPGIYPAFGQRRLSDMLLQAGGTTPAAGDKISIVRAGQTALIVVSLSDAAAKASEFVVLPGDTVSVSKAGIVYVLGEVTRPGGFVLQNAEEGQTAGMSAIQAMALASGPTRTASLNKARIIRRSSKGLEQIELPLKKIMEGKGSDPQLYAEDILYVPNSRVKAMADQVPAALVTVLASAAIYHF